MGNPPTFEEESLSLLLVEDDETDALLFNRALTKSGIRCHNIQHAMLLKDALALIAEHSFDIAFVDLNLPDSTNDEGIRALREAMPETAIIVLTGVNAPAMVRNAVQLGVQEYLLKDELLRRSDLSRLVSSVRQRHAQQQQILAEQQRSFHQATHDELTKLANRPAFLQRLHLQLADAVRTNHPFAVCFIDLDGFKPINDTHGHAAGDEVLRVVGTRLTEALRDGDTAARLGGDEFALILTTLRKIDDASYVADRVLVAIAQPITLPGGKIVEVKGSIGVSVFPGDGKKLETLVAHADTAMYAAKGSGKNCVRFFQPEMTAEASHRRQLEDDLRSAIENNEFRLFYQPLFDAKAGKPVAMEVLLRWEHPRLGMLAPNRFIDVALENGMIVEIGGWVAEQACEQIGHWRNGGGDAAFGDGMRLSLNVSTRELLATDFLTRLMSSVDAAGIPPDTLELDITEDSLAHDPQRMAEIVKDIAAAGVRIALDDFGSGYSSLASLNTLPISTLKLHPSLLDDLRSEAEDTSLVSGTRGLADALKMDLVVEGVETQTEFELLQNVGCRYMQGYYLQRPCLASEVLPLLRKRKHSVH